MPNEEKFTGWSEVMRVGSELEEALKPTASMTVEELLVGTLTVLTDEITDSYMFYMDETDKYHVIDMRREDWKNPYKYDTCEEAMTHWMEIVRA